MALLHPRGDFVPEPHGGPADELPCPRDTDQEADNHEGADRLQVAAIAGMTREADPGDQLDDEDDEQPDQEREVEEANLLGAPTRVDTHHRRRDEQQADDGDRQRRITGVVAGNQAEQDHRQGVREGRERRRRPNAVNVGGLWAEDALRRDGYRHEEEAYQCTPGARAGGEEIVCGGRAHRSTSFHDSKRETSPHESQTVPPMSALETMTYEVGGRIARITLDRPERGNGLTPTLIAELVSCVERADLDPAVHVILLAGNGRGFCGGYDLVESAEADMTGLSADAVSGSPLDPAVIAANHDPSGTWDPMIDHAMMGRNVRAFMSLFYCGKPVVCKVHGFCVAGGTDLALCSDLLLIAEDAKIGYPPARVWGSPTTSMWAHRLGPQRAKRLLFTGDCLSGAEALEWGLAIEAPPAEELDERTEILLGRIARMPVNQLMMMKLLINQETMSHGLHSTQILGTVFDGIARHTPEGYDFQRRAAEAGFREAVRERDEPFGDLGASSFKG